jgi:DNA-binding SARP family transcriptional activator
MRIALLGGARVDGDGGSVPLRTRQHACVLAFITLNKDRAVTRDEFANVLWPGRLPPTWETSLRVVISRVRAVLATQGTSARIVAAGSSAYRLELAGDVSVDVDEVAERLAGAEGALARDRPRDALTDATAAATLAGITLLPGEDGDWLVPHRDRITRQRLNALDVACRAAIALGNGPAALHAAAEALSIDPIQESSHRLVMSAHVAAGDRAAALVAYERCRALLAEELGTDPSPETQALHQEILRVPAARRAPAAGVPGPLRQHASPFVGRTDELGVVRSALDRALSGITEVAVISGEAGIGKTRLCAELAGEAVTRDAVVLYGRCNEDPVGSYEPFAEALARRVREWPLLATLAAPAAAPLLPGLDGDRVPSPRDPQSERLRLFEAAADLLEAAAGDRPGVLLILDDLQWADRSTLVLLEHVVRSRPECRLAIVCTYRGLEPQDRVRDSLTELERVRPVARVRLSGLQTADIGRLAEEWAPGSGRHLAVALVERTDGNPFFVLEILRHLRDASVPAQLSPAGLDYAGTPSGVRDVVNQRLARLSPDARAVLLHACVIGREFDVALLECLAGPELDVPVVLQEAATAGVVEEMSDAIGHYRFSHHLVRQVMYDDLTPTLRARHHLRTGEALEALVADRAGHRIAELAHHYASAAAAGGVVKAVRYASLAGDHALSVLAFEEAAGHYRRGLGLCPEDDDEARVRLLTSLADAHARAGEAQLAWMTLQEALPVAERAELLEDLGAALVRATSSLATDWDERTWDFGRQYLTRLGDRDSPVHSILLSRLALSTQSFGAPPEATEHSVPLSVRAYDMAERLDDPRAMAAAIQARILCDPSPELFMHRPALLDRLVRLSVETGDDALLMNAHLWLGMECLARGELAGAHSSLEVFDRMGRESAHPWTEWRRLVADSTWAIMRGDFEAAERAMQAEAQTQTVVPQAMIYLVSHLYQLRREQGRVAEIEQQMMAFSGLPALVAWLVLLHIDLGRRTEARAMFDRIAQDRFASIPARNPGWWIAIVLLAYACDELGDVDRARELTQMLAPAEGRHIVQSGMGGYWGPADLALGGLAATMGDDERAECHLLRAIDMCDDVCTPTWKARAQLRLGRVLLERDERRARGLLDEAREAAERIGMHGLVARLRAIA